MTGFAQYILNGSAKKVSCNCYTLTEEKQHQSGSVWNAHKVDLTQSFDFWFSVFTGCNDSSGADGIVFMLQPISTSIGSTAAGMGFEGISPSIGIVLDTWQNTDLNDPFFDHISIQANGQLAHGNDLAGPVPVSATSNNVEDCRWHVLRIVWNAATQSLQAYFDGVLRVEKNIDLVNVIFGGQPLVYWGFSGATGGSVNLQQFCTALNPLFTTGPAGISACEDVPVQFTNTSESFAPITNYAWSFGDGATSTAANPQHLYAKPGQYPVSLTLTGLDGCEKDSTLLITVGANPAATLRVFDTCEGFLPRLQFTAAQVGVSYQWWLNGTPFSTALHPSLSALKEGNHEVSVKVTSDFGCGVPAEAAAAFTIQPTPKVSVQVLDGCVDVPLRFTSRQTDDQATITQWHWRFGDGESAAAQTTTHRYRLPQAYSVAHWAITETGCVSDTVFTRVSINEATVFAGNDTTVIMQYPFQLHGSGNGSFLWSPATGMSNATLANPVVILQSDQQFVLTVTTAEGCTAADSILLKVYKGPAVYVPTAFTPNGDGKNEILRPVYAGIKELKQFTVYNRHGQAVFATRDLQKGWDGKGAGQGTYVWLIQVVDHQGQHMILKGTVTLIR